MDSWSPDSWRTRPAQQQPRYADPAALDAVVDRLRGLPPLVTAAEVEELKAELALAAGGGRFLLQAGDCAEPFGACGAVTVRRKLRFLLELGDVLARGTGRPVVPVGRIAGQFAKPRTTDTERVGDVELPVYRGDNVNRADATWEARQPDPALLEQGYWHAARAMDALRTHAASERRPLFSSHEALLLPFEEAMTRPAGEDGRAYGLGAHFLWLGDRTRHLEGAHVEFLRGIANPIGIKVGPRCAPEELVALVRLLDPRREPGRITLITRYGKDAIRGFLPLHVRALRAAGLEALWCCDPMHGNTRLVRGRKTRHFDDVMEELRTAFALHAEEGSRLGGIHLELTDDAVTECLGGPEGLDAGDLDRRYETACDPRLNAAQGLELASDLSRMLHREQPPCLAAQLPRGTGTYPRPE
ncbi:3-deoxy-7-phosphoheptulonate synthase class II [Pyxidicoccus sp. MSG2]|uniref:3-deoxy-7-phosphoheptulonate synthase class II n=1 Tax=Pyxidicoccus sp. MSG2 TaxID=2996790 RepID=UPI0022702AA9|nr:3-deoxy-7-phosphoheptulonate synthase class II [Pyxidicoccus sp. MSG2]MCY1021693.1 3-deoxy-7-phosphoheptulonate synthase class II [Pyxidicoccus sp. MSG2]